MQPQPLESGKLAAPLIIGRDEIDRFSHWRQAESTGQLDTKEAIDVNTVGLRTPAERAFPSRGAPGKREV
ncbi:MAG: hypothetical protein AAGA35_03095 [Patescibacteria group bacterium]